MKARLTAHTEADLLRGIDWFDRISTGLDEPFVVVVGLFTSGEDERDLQNRG